MLHVDLWRINAQKRFNLLCRQWQRKSIPAEVQSSQEFKKNDTTKLVIIRSVLQFLYEKRERGSQGCWCTRLPAFHSITTNNTEICQRLCEKWKPVTMKAFSLKDILALYSVTLQKQHKTRLPVPEEGRTLYKRYYHFRMSLYKSRAK